MKKLLWTICALILLSFSLGACQSVGGFEEDVTGSQAISSAAGY